MSQRAPHGYRPAAGLNPLSVKMGRDCAVHQHREHVPLERHHIWPLGMGGPDAETNKVTVCANGHYSIHAVLDLLVRYDGKVPGGQLRSYGFKVRRLATRGYHEWKASQ